jgi:hypothetical protein
LIPLAMFMLRFAPLEHFSAKVYWNGVFGNFTDFDFSELNVSHRGRFDVAERELWRDSLKILSFYLPIMKHGDPSYECSGSQHETDFPRSRLIGREIDGGGGFCDFGCIESGESDRGKGC